MKRILDGVARFQDEIFPAERELWVRLASGQSPEALLLTCSDSRIVPDLMTQTKPGDLFICRNAGNIAPAYGEFLGGVSATIEYAVMALKVKDIIVCGHADCGAMKALLHPEMLATMPSVERWLRHAERARFIVQENYSHLDEPAKLDVLIEQNVLAQLENLETHPCVAARVHSASLRLHGWVFEIETGRIRAWDPAREEFISIREAFPSVAADRRA